MVFVCFQIQFEIKLPTDSEYLKNMYAKDQYTYHSTCFYRIVTFTVQHSTHKQVDNATVTYFDHFNNLQIGIIIGIIQLKATKDIIFIINQADIVGFDIFSLDRIEYFNGFLVYAKHTNLPTIVSINYKSVRAKVAYRKDPKVKTSTEFYIFPNPVEDTRFFLKTSLCTISSNKKFAFSAALLLPHTHTLLLIFYLYRI